MPKKVIKAWITKYALTKGIYETEALECNTPGAIQVSEPGDGSKYYHDEGKEWCRSKQDAIDIATTMKIKKIMSLQKQIKKLQIKVFS